MKWMMKNYINFQKKANKKPKVLFKFTIDQVDVIKL